MGNPAFNHELLLEIFRLRAENDQDAFMDKLYQAVTGDFSDIFVDKKLSKELLEAFSIMLQYFQQKEEYEKCAVLNALLNK